MKAIATAISGLTLALIFVATSCAYGTVYFEDHFTQADGPDPAWRIDAGSFLVENEVFRPEWNGSHRVLAYDPANPTELLSLDDFEASYHVAVANESGFVFHYDPDNTGNFVLFILANNAIYWHNVVGGDYGGTLNWVTVGALDYNNVTFWVKCENDVATAAITDGVNVYTNTLTLTANTDAAGIGFFTGGPAQRPKFDDVLVTSVGAMTGSVQGTITDAQTGSPIANATVEVRGTLLSTTTGLDGTYTLTGVPTGGQTLDIHRHVYLNRAKDVFVVSSLPAVGNQSLYPLVGIDWARCAGASVSSGAGSGYGINDGLSIPITGWAPVAPGDWAKLTWDEPLTISKILIDTEGPSSDCTIESSTNGTDWSLVKNVTSSETGHTHWFEIVDLGSPLTLRHLRVTSNSGEAYKIWAIECYKAAGAVSGFVRDQNGAAVSGAQVIVNDVAGLPATGYASPVSSILPIKTTTGLDGSYSVPVPEGTVTVRAAAADSLAVTGGALAVTATQTTIAPDIAVTRVGANEVFFDLFNYGDGEDDPNFTERSGGWSVMSGQYQTTGGPSFATVTGLQLRDCVIETDFDAKESGAMARYHDPNNFVYVTFDTNGYFYWVEHYAGGWPLQAFSWPSVDYVPGESLHLRVVVAGNHGQAFLTDGNNTYASSVATFNNLSGSGPLGIGEVGLWHNAATTVNFDNFRVSESTAPVPPPVSVGTAKAAAAGWTGQVKGIVTAVFKDYGSFVIEDQDRTSAIVITPIRGTALSIGQEVVVAGQKQANGTLSMWGDASLTGNTVDMKPVGLINRNITGAAGNGGLDNMSVLVTTWGRVIDSPGLMSDLSLRFHVADGSAVEGGPAVTVVPTQYVGLFSDDFEAGKKPEWHDWGTATTASGGKLLAGNGTVTSVDGLNVSDVILTADAKISGGEMDLMLRFKDKDNFLLCVCGIWSYMWFHEVVGGVYSGGFGWTYAPLGENVHLTARAVGNNVTVAASDGTNTYTGSVTTSINWSGTVGLFHNGAPTQSFDNVFVAGATGGSPYSVLADAVQVIVPPSVTLTTVPSIGDYVRITGIAGRASATDGYLRSVTVRQPSDESKIPE